MGHHLLIPPLGRYARGQVDLGPAPADCTQLGLLDYEFREDGSDECDCMCGSRALRNSDHAPIGIEGRRGIGRSKVDEDAHAHPRDRRQEGT